MLRGVLPRSGEEDGGTELRQRSYWLEPTHHVFIILSQSEVKIEARLQKRYAGLGIWREALRRPGSKVIPSLGGSRTHPRDGSQVQLLVDEHRARAKLHVERSARVCVSKSAS